MVLLELLEAVHGAVEHEPRAIGRRQGRVVERIDDVMAGVPGPDFEHRALGDLFGCHEFHLTGGRDRLEFPPGKEPVFAGVDIHRFEGLLCRRCGPRHMQAEHPVKTDRPRRGAIHELDRFSPAGDFAVRDLLPCNGGCRLDFLGDGGVGRPAHEEQEKRVRPRDRGFREEHA